ERIVQFNQVEIFGADACFRVCLRDRLASQFGVVVFRTAINALAARDRGYYTDCARSIYFEFLDRVIGSDDHRRGSFAYWAALQARERAGDRGAGHHFFNSYRPLPLRERIVGAVAIVLDRNLRDLFGA